jgi:hypothetical protein
VSCTQLFELFFSITHLMSFDLIRRMDATLYTVF